jgi:hypothetical protein
MVTEDLLKTVRIYQLGYYCIYRNVVTGEWIPTSLDALESMWLRWTYGGQQVFFKYFREIMTTPNLRPLERLDLVTFILHYFVGAMFFPLSLAWSLFLAPAQVGVWSLIMMYAPLLASGALIYQRYTRHLRVSPAQKLWRWYAGTFLVEAYIFTVQLQGVVNFLTGRPQGWRVTAKSVETIPSWGEVASRHSTRLLLALGMVLCVLAVWAVRFSFSNHALFFYSPLLLTAVFLVHSIVAFGRSGRVQGNHAGSATIDSYLRRTSRGDSEPDGHVSAPQVAGALSAPDPQGDRADGVLAAEAIPREIADLG